MTIGSCTVDDDGRTVVASGEVDGPDVAQVRLSLVLRGDDRVGLETVAVAGVDGPNRWSAEHRFDHAVGDPGCVIERVERTD